MVKLTQGEDKTLTVTVKNLSGDLLSEVTAEFKNEDGSKIQKKLTEEEITIVQSEEPLIFTVVLSQEDTAAMLAGNVNWRLQLDYGAVRKIKVVKNSLFVQDPSSY